MVLSSQDIDVCFQPGLYISNKTSFELPYFSNKTSIELMVSPSGKEMDRIHRDPSLFRQTFSTMGGSRIESGNGIRPCSFFTVFRCMAGEWSC